MTLVEGEGTAALAGIPRTGPAPTDPVRLVMARRLLGVASERSLRDVARELYESEVGVVLVDNPGGATGLLSERDLVAVHFRDSGPGVAHPDAASLVELAVPRFLREEHDQVFDVVPMYLRKSDAEIAWDDRARGRKP